MLTGIPFICKVTVAAKTFEKGKFHLGWLSKTISWLAILGLCFNIVRALLSSLHAPIVSFSEGTGHRQHLGRIAGRLLLI